MVELEVGGRGDLLSVVSSRMTVVYHACITFESMHNVSRPDLNTEFVVLAGSRDGTLA